ncbi:MAG: hypothetical protein ABGY95_02365 [Rubritalea sp.]|uniref:hypothetical protein n=1 Tax=Rubritalea sp. TaxID=2109375 RepID=UPI00324235F3
MAGHERHDWTEETEEGTRVYKAVFFAREWRFATSMKGSRRQPVDWRDIHDVTPELWQTLRDILFRKYQRKRCPWKFIEDIDKKLGREIDDIKQNRGK